MPTCPSSCTGSCPEIVPVTITQVTISFDTSEIANTREYFVGADFTDNGDGTSYITLGAEPLDPEQVSVIYNGNEQGEDAAGAQANFSVSGSVLTLKFVPTAAETIQVKYWAAA